MKGLFIDKKIITVCTGLVAAVTFMSAPMCKEAYAESAEVRSGEYGFVYDEGDLLTDEEEEDLQEKLEEVGSIHDIQIAVVTTDSYSQYTIDEYADDMMDYDELGMNSGNDDSAILLAVCMNTREFYESTRGEAIQIFTDDTLYSLEDKYTSYLSSGNYSMAFNKFADGVDTYCTAYANRDKIPAWKWVVCFLLGLLFGGVTVGVMASGMKNVKQNDSAAQYEQKNNVKITGRYDRFIRKSVSKTRKESENRSSGGSTTHRSSSGNTHGGHGGHF